MSYKNIERDFRASSTNKEVFVKQMRILQKTLVYGKTKTYNYATNKIENEGGKILKNYIRKNTKLPQYLPLPTFLLKMELSQTARIIYATLLSRSTLSMKNKNIGLVIWGDVGTGKSFMAHVLQMNC